MVEIFNPAQGSDNTAVVTDYRKEGAANMAVESWKDREKMSLNKAVPGEAGAKSVEFDDVFKKCGPNVAAGDTDIKKHENGEAKNQAGKANVAGADTTLSIVPHDGGLKTLPGGGNHMSHEQSSIGKEKLPNKNESISEIVKDLDKKF